MIKNRGVLKKDLASPIVDPTLYVRNLPEVGDPLLHPLKEIEIAKNEIEKTIKEAKEFIKWKKKVIKGIKKKLDQAIRKNWTPEEIQKAMKESGL